MPTSKNNVAVYLNKGAGVFSTSTPSPSAAPSASCVRASASSKVPAAPGSEEEAREEEEEEPPRGEEEEDLPSSPLPSEPPAAPPCREARDPRDPREALEAREERRAREVAAAAAAASARPPEARQEACKLELEASEVEDADIPAPQEEGEAEGDAAEEAEEQAEEEEQRRLEALREEERREAQRRAQEARRCEEERRERERRLANLTIPTPPLPVGRPRNGPRGNAAAAATPVAPPAPPARAAPMKEEDAAAPPPSKGPETHGQEQHLPSMATPDSKPGAMRPLETCAAESHGACLGDGDGVSFHIKGADFEGNFCEECATFLQKTQQVEVWRLEPLPQD